MRIKHGFLGRRHVPASLLQSVAFRIVLLFLLVYLFILAISLLGAAFKHAGADFAKQLFVATSNPVVGLVIGVLATSIVQSSSTTTSLIVGLVGSGILPFEASIPMVMGANIGTTITNTIVSLGSLSRGDEFRRAFSGSTVHDFFNLCSVAVLLPLQAKYNLIGRSAMAVETMFEGFGGAMFTSPLSVITKPVAKWLLHLTGDSSIIDIVNVRHRAHSQSGSLSGQSR